MWRGPILPTAYFWEAMFCLYISKNMEEQRRWENGNLSRRMFSYIVSVCAWCFLEECPIPRIRKNTHEKEKALHTLRTQSPHHSYLLYSVHNNLTRLPFHSSPSPATGSLRWFKLQQGATPSHFLLSFPVSGPPGQLCCYALCLFFVSLRAQNLWKSWRSGFEGL